MPLFVKCYATTLAILLPALYAGGMKQLLLVTNPVRLTYLESLLTGAGINFSVHDRHIANLLAGANSLFPMRLMVAESDWQQAKRVLMEADQFYDE